MRHKDKNRTCFSYEMKQLAKVGLVQLDPLVMSILTRLSYAKGLYINCTPCSKYRPCTEGNIYLRRLYYECYY